MTGPDSYLRMKPEEEIIKKYKLSSYVRQADKLATNLEAKIKENFEFKTKGVVESKNYYSVLVYYKSFYYREYIEDFNAIVRILINKEKLNIDASTEVDYEKVAEIYKIQVKAMEILNKHNMNYILCIIVRYFGGIKLGAGGLVRAYSSSVRKSLEEAQIKELVEALHIRIKTEYQNENKLIQLLGKENIIKKEYKESLIIEGIIKKEEIDHFSSLKIEIIEKTFL